MDSTDGIIPFAGVAQSGLGVALWQADGTGPEPAAAGHAFDTPVGRINSHYYIASRDYDGIDPRARGALAARAPLRGFTRLAAALAAAGLAPDALVIRLPLITPGADREGIEWHYRDGVETRHLRPSGPVPMLVASEAALDLAVARLVLVEDYRGATTFADVRLSLESDPFTVTPVPTARGRAAAVARAMVQDINGRNLRFVVDRLVLLPEKFSGSGRTQGFFGEIPLARLEIIP